VAARFFRGGALAALCNRSRRNPYWLAFRVVAGLVDFLFLFRASADACDEKHGGDQADRWVAPDCRMALLVLVCIHVAAALVHIFVYRDRIMQRMLPIRR
jgi:cytochrome b561